MSPMSTGTRSIPKKPTAVIRERCREAAAEPALKRNLRQHSKIYATGARHRADPPAMWLVTCPDPRLVVIRSPLGPELHVWRCAGETLGVWCWRGRGVVEAAVGRA